jgi:hypothetical protein
LKHEEQNGEREECNKTSIKAFISQRLTAEQTKPTDFQRQG